MGQWSVESLWPPCSLHGSLLLCTGKPVHCCESTSPSIAAFFLQYDKNWIVGLTGLGKLLHIYVFGLLWSLLASTCSCCCPVLLDFGETVKWCSPGSGPCAPCTVCISSILASLAISNSFSSLVDRYLFSRLDTSVLSLWISFVLSSHSFSSSVILFCGSE